MYIVMIAGLELTLLVFTEQGVQSAISVHYSISHTLLAARELGAAC